MTGRWDDVALPLYTVGQVATMLDVQPAFLRRLDEQGVVQPARSGGNQRRYSRQQLERLGRARSLLDQGLTLTGVRMVLQLQDRIADLESELAEVRGGTGAPARR